MVEKEVRVELKHWRRKANFRKVVTFVYALAFAIYLVIGLQPAGAHSYEISGSINIPSINLTSDVTTLELVDHKLETPDTIVGSYAQNNNKIFLIGHSSTVFKNLSAVHVEDSIYYNGAEYKIIKTETLAKSDINMNKLLAAEEKETLVIMTCAGEILDNQDATHRFIVTALRK